MVLIIIVPTLNGIPLSPKLKLENKNYLKEVLGNFFFNLHFLEEIELIEKSF